MHVPYLLLKYATLLLGLQELLRALFEGSNCCIFVLLCLPFLGLKLTNFSWVPSRSFLGQLLLEATQLYLILSKQCSLINIFVDSSFILDFLGAGGEL